MKLYTATSKYKETDFKLFYVLWYYLVILPQIQNQHARIKFTDRIQQHFYY